MTATESDFVAFTNYVIGQTHTLAARAMSLGQKEIGLDLLTLCGVAGKKHRELLGMEEPDPDVDYDPDCHWDGTPLLPGETRREKGDSYADGLDLSALDVTEDVRKERE